MPHVPRVRCALRGPRGSGLGLSSQGPKQQQDNDKNNNDDNTTNDTYDFINDGGKDSKLATW
jgi:hypothetical protein